MDNLSSTAGNDVLVDIGTDFTKTDRIDFSAFNQTIDGGIDSDWLVGGDSKDLIYADYGSDIIFAGNDDDYLDGGEDSDYLFGDTGNDIIFGGNGDDYLNGGEGNDIISGDGGDDIIYAETGDDIITGGTGFDRFFYATGMPFTTTDFGVDTLTDFTTGEDKIVLDRHTFGSLTSEIGVGFSNQTDFAIVASDAEAEGSSAAIVYNIGTGSLFYNQNGVEVGFGTGGLFASLSGIPHISSNDFEIKPPLEA